MDSVLTIEKELSKTFPSDQQYCYEERNNRVTRMPCKDYAAAFHDRLAGQVEARMRSSILVVGSAWYTAWVDAGQPVFESYESVSASEKDVEEQKRLDELFKGGAIKGRTHGQ